MPAPILWRSFDCLNFRQWELLALAVGTKSGNRQVIELCFALGVRSIPAEYLNVGRVLGLTESRVSQIHSQAVLRLKGQVTIDLGRAGGGEGA